VNVRSSWPWLCAALLLATASDAGARLPAPLLEAAWLYPFPGAFPGPASAVSAGLGLSDRWLGDEPFDNPAAAPARGVMVAPVFQRVKRQDLPADYDYNEIEGYLDLAGGWLSLPVRGVGVTLYAFEPVLRLEDAAFTTRQDPDQVLPPRTFTATSSARELRAGLAFSHAWRGTRFGAAVEWTRREDSYDFDEIQPQPGLSHVDFSGDGVGFQAGARVPVASAVELGGALRYVPALDLSGQQSSPSLVAVLPVSATRDAGWDGGVSARWSVSGAFRVLASLGGSTAQAWDGFGVSAGRAVSWSAGLEYEEPEQPWAFRFGLGQEQQDGVPEPRAAAYALGLGWKADALRLDLGVLRRSFERAGKATSYDDRVVVGVTAGF
jgi:hypothetical protein